MSRRRKEHTASPAAAPDRFRRVLLGAITALLVARPIVFGEDPGRVRALESTASQTLNLLWLAVAAVAAVWFARTTRRIQLGPIPIGLMLAGIIAVAATVIVPSYRHPAWLIVSEWLTLPVMFILIQNVTADEDAADDSKRGLMAAVLASAMSVAAFAGYQAIAPLTGWPSADQKLITLASTSNSADFFGIADPATSTRIVRGTFEYADSLVAFLLLMLPIAGGYALFGAGWRAKVCGLLLPLIAAVLMMAGRNYAQNEGMAPQMVRLGVAADLAVQKPLLGVAPGNFGQHAPRFVVDQRPDSLAEPADSWVSLAATMGIPAALLIAGLIIIAVRNLMRTPPAPPPTEALPPSPRWEYYLGGMCGLLLGLVLRVNDLPATEAPREIMRAGVAAGARALVWFLVFALFDGISLRGRARGFAAAAGLITATMFGFFSPALLRPALQQPLWAIAAIALASPAVIAAPERRNLRWLVIPAAFGVAVMYFLLIWDPAFQSTSKLRDARRASRHYFGKILEYRSLSAGEQKRRAKEFRKYVEEKILEPLEQADALDPGNVHLHIESAHWHRQFWNDLHTDGVLEKKALAQIEPTHYRMPHGTDSLLAELHLRLTLCRLRLKYGSQALSEKEENEIQRQMNEHFQRAEELIPEIATRSPALESRLRYRLSAAFLNSKSDARKLQAKAEAIRTLELDDAPNLPWKLTPSQRAQLRRWAELPPEDER
jgi:hypothetical protein